MHVHNSSEFRPAAGRHTRHYDSRSSRPPPLRDKVDAAARAPDDRELAKAQDRVNAVI
jgi:hypothetical protein